MVEEETKSPRDRQQEFYQFEPVEEAFMAASSKPREPFSKSSNRVHLTDF